MAYLSAQEARSKFTRAVLATYRETSLPTSFLRSFFRTQVKSTLNLFIEVQRGYEKVAADVVRGSDGNRNDFGKSTEKGFTPPYYNEYFDVTQLDSYRRLFLTNGQISAEEFGEFTAEVAQKLQMLQAKIERAYEKMCADSFETGVITLKDGTTIDFKRKGDSIYNATGNTWATGTNNPITDIERGCNFIRQEGKVQGGRYNIIMGSEALNAYLGNTIAQKRADIRTWSLDSIAMPQRNSVGGTLHGEISVGSYKANVWTYPEFYDNESGDSTPYINPKKIIILPESTRFDFGYAAVPQLPTVNGGRVIAAPFVMYDFPDERKSAHDFGLKSAGLSILTAVDQVYTAQVVA